MINRDTPLADVVLAEPSVLPVLNRLGISLGLGDTTVEQAASALTLDPQFLVTILNTYTDVDYFPERAFSAFSLEQMVGYLNKTYVYYTRFLLPNIDRHFSLLMATVDAEQSNLNVIKAFYEQVKEELLHRIAADVNEWFPSVLKHAKQASPLEPETPLPAADDDDSESLENKIDDLKSMLVIHLKGDHDSNLAYAVLVAINNLQHDYRKNNRLRNRILRPFDNLLKSLQ